MDSWGRRSAQTGTNDGQSIQADWLRGLKVYLAVTVVANLAWEILQLPLYTIWANGTAREIAFAVLHCTAGDVLIALTALVAGLIFAGNSGWPARGFVPVLLATVALGVGYTIFSEWLNIVVRASWAYSSLMPVVPFINTGLSPLLQWIVVPFVAMSAARSAAAP